MVCPEEGSSVTRYTTTLGNYATNLVLYTGVRRQFMASTLPNGILIAECAFSSQAYAAPSSDCLLNLWAFVA